MSDDPEAHERLIANEQLKLTATLLNSIASGSFLAGVIGPLVSGFYAVKFPISAYWGAFVLCWVLVAAGFHLLARTVLRSLNK